MELIEIIHLPEQLKFHLWKYRNTFFSIQMYILKITLITLNSSILKPYNKNTWKTPCARQTSKHTSRHNSRTNWQFRGKEPCPCNMNMPNTP